MMDLLLRRARRASCLRRRGAWGRDENLCLHAPPGNPS